MKKLILLFVLFCTNLPFLVADDYIPLVKEGAVWVYDWRFQMGDPASNYMKYWFEGDTIIEGEQYKCQYIELALSYPERSVTKRFHRAWQEQNKKVYVWNNNLHKKDLYYDFNLKKGDSVPYLPNDPVDAKKEVTDEDTIKVNGIKRRRLQFTYDYVYMGNRIEITTYWVEGIGGCKSLLNSNGAVGWDGPDGFEYFENGTCLFTQENFYLPRNGQGTASDIPSHYDTNTEKGHSPVYFDLQGRRLKGEPKRGLYIKDGKKVVKRF